MEENATKYDILQMIEMLVELKLNMKTILNTDLHFHLGDCLGFFNIAVVMENCKI
jgi:hypothetical protein